MADALSELKRQTLGCERVCRRIPCSCRPSARRARASFRSQAFAGESVVADSLGGALDPASSPPLAHPSRTNDEATALAVSQDVFHHRSAAIPGVSSRSPPDT